MKKIILFALVVGAMSFQLNAQKRVTLTINHHLGESMFEFNKETSNNLDHKFEYSRLEYYLSGFSIEHNNGEILFIPRTWILVNTDEPTFYDFGELNIDEVEKINFHIGVDEANNHLDPSTYPIDHPLAPKAPSMHWGWVGGYRFIALEGNSGPSLNQQFQLHGLGDDNYYKTSIQVAESGNNEEVNLIIDADYTRAMENIDLNSGVIVHGEDREARQCLQNFRDFVFSPSSIASYTIDFSEINEFNVFPNPVVNGVSTLKLDLKESGFDYDLTITSLDGKQLDYLLDVTDNQTLNFTNWLSGMYFINLVKEGQTIITKKVFVK